jgi:PEP-CTERM motif
VSGIPRPNKVNRLACASLAAAMFFGAPAAKADLIGAQVTLGAYFAATPTTPLELVSNVLNGTVPVNFPVGSLTSATPPFTVIEASFEVSANQIIETAAENFRASSGSFNGPIYTFSGAPAITDVTIDPATPPAARPVSITFTSNSIAVNDAGLSVLNGAMQILDVTTGSVPVPTPEPSTLALLGVGLAGLLAFRYRAVR